MATGHRRTPKRQPLRCCPASLASAAPLKHAYSELDAVLTPPAQ